MIKFYLNSKTLFLAHFLSIWAKKCFFQKLWFCHAQLHKGSSTSTRVRISNDPIPVKHPDSWQYGKTERLLPATARGSNKCNCSRLAFKSQRYRVRWWSNKKLLHHSQHAKNQLNSCTHSQRCSLRSKTISGNWQPLKNDEKCFLFRVKIFVMYTVGKRLD